MKVRLSIFLAAVAAAGAVSVGPGSGTAHACGAYWNIPIGNGCQNYTASEGHSETVICCAVQRYTRSTFTVYSTIRHFWTSAGGTWKGSYNQCYDCGVFWSISNGTDKLGCFNDHGGTMFVNCHQEGGWP